MKKILLFLPFIFSCVSPQIAVNKKADFSKIKRIAVLNFSGPEGATVADIFTITFLKHGADVVERQQLEAVTKELNLSQSELSDPGTRKKIGKLLSVDALVIGSVTSYKPNTKYLMRNSSGSFDSVKEIKGKNIYIQNFDPSTDTSILETTAEIGISMRMIDTENGSILYSAYMSYEGLDIPSTVQSISEYFVKSLSKYWNELI